MNRPIRHLLAMTAQLKLRPPVMAAFVMVSAVAAVVGAPRADVLSLGVEGRANLTPWIAAEGRNVAVAWGATAAGKTDVFVAVSRDGGSSFGAPVRVNAAEGTARLGGELPPRVAVTADAIVVLWTSRGASTSIEIARSSDGGRTFSPGTSLQAAGAAGDRGWPSLSIGSDGVAHAFWLDHRGLAAARDGGKPAAGKPVGQHGAGHETHDGAALAQKSAIYHASFGRTASAERSIAPGVCYCCKTATATGAGGRVDAAWRHVYPGNIRDIAFASSSDGGQTFSAPSRVSEDGWQIAGCPDDGPAMAVDRKGVVHLVWPTVIGGATPEGALFYATSSDGRSFSPRVRLQTLGSAHPTHPQIAVDGAGRVVVAWDERIDGRRVVAARVVSPPPAPHTAPVILTDGEAGQYPVLATSGATTLAAWATGGESSVIKVRRVP
jgi:hypothetical protein